MAAVQAALAAGRIEAVAGRIDQARADEDWLKNTDSGKTPPMGNGRLTAPGLAGQRELESRERTRALRLANDELEGRLLRADDVEATWSKQVMVARDALRRVPSALHMRQPDLTPAALAALADLIDGVLRDLGGKRQRHGKVEEGEASAPARSRHLGSQEERRKLDG